MAKSVQSSTAKVEITPTTLSVQTLYRMFRDGGFFVNREYQRKIVWTKAEKQNLINSILSEFPIPLILLSKRVRGGKSQYEIIDGLQRLHPVFAFIENAYALPDGRYFNTEHMPRAKQAAEDKQFTPIAGDVYYLSLDECAIISDYSIPVTTIERATGDAVISIFERINSYGRRLSEQEQRQAGLRSAFSRLVRRVSAEIRGDASDEVVPLKDMPLVSIDMPGQPGRGIPAEESFWCKQGILRSTNLRDSLDEQVVADIIACILNKRPIQRSKASLDRIYTTSHADFSTMEAAIAKYGEDDLRRDIIAVFDTIKTICDTIYPQGLRDAIFQGAHSNPISTIFAAIFLAIYELQIIEGRILADATKIADALPKLNLRTRREAIDPEMRTANVNAIKGALQPAFAAKDSGSLGLGRPLVFTFENSLRRSLVETPHYEFKQGVLRLDGEFQFDEGNFLGILQTICAMANTVPQKDSFLYLGIADKQKDADRVSKLYKIKPREFEGRFVVGIDREAKKQKESIERYVERVRNKIQDSELSDFLIIDVLQRLDTFKYGEFHVVRIGVPGQRRLSFYGDECFVRQGSATARIKASQIPSIARRFEDV